ncbi:hypothetical protein MMON_00860 [Mycolicibacterium monacense]|uniref:Uncharacterized protein n=1 Tax=Mycolicibacterium monacense TaxID=85693 RepID=A0AAD1IRS2_MYCMB|nr:hypothetical protein MMON_00860 [Mycolicibacterium monacense]
MRGFAVVDRQAAADQTVIWLTGHLEGVRVGHTNAVVIPGDDDRHGATVWNLTADRAIVLTHGSAPPWSFRQTLTPDAFEDLIDETAAFQRRIADAVTRYASEARNRNLVTPEFSSHPPPGC